MKLCEDYSILFSNDSGAALVTTIQAADIYLSSARARPSADLDTIPDLTETDFYKFILGIALTAYSQR